MPDHPTRRATHTTTAEPAAHPRQRTTSTTRTDRPTPAQHKTGHSYSRASNPPATTSHQHRSTQTHKDRLTPAQHKTGHTNHTHTRPSMVDARTMEPVEMDTRGARGTETRQQTAEGGDEADPPTARGVQAGAAVRPPRLRKAPHHQTAIRAIHTRTITQNAPGRGETGGDMGRHDPYQPRQHGLTRCRLGGTTQPP